MDTEEDLLVTRDEPLIPEHTKQAARALALLLLYSFLMFTLPFAAFFGTKYLLQDVFDITGFPNTAWSVLASVIIVNLIIVAYVYHAYHEKEYNEIGEEIVEGKEGAGAEESEEVKKEK